jgi:peptide/nickel transport system substrate-binding protein
MEERDVLFNQALPISMESSVRIFLTDKLSFVPFRNNVETAYDLAAGISNGQLTRWTLKFGDTAAGDMVFAMPDLLVDPWNPLAGSNWVYDHAPELMTADEAVVLDPYTGLTWPQRVESVDVYIEEGLPVNQTLDWMNVQFVPSIEVPADAWSDWNAADQVFITAGERFPDGATAKVKSVCTYPADLFDTVYWHDGTPLSVADFVMGMIMPWDAAMEDSAIYDASQTPNYEAGIEAFKGWRITSTDPLVVEWYTDAYALDAELDMNCGWPDYGYGDGAWHMMAVGYLADASKEVAFSADKAEELEVEWMNYASGPSLGVLSYYLDQAFNESFIPYEPTLGQYITPEQAAQAYYNYKTWFRNHGHLWIGTGPYFVDQIFPVEKTLVLKHNPYYPDRAGKWDRFTEAKVGVVEVDGPGLVTIGDEAAYDVYVDFKGAPYPADEISQVKYLVFDATGGLLTSGEATLVADGQYQVVLDADLTAGLGAGANKLEVAVVSKLVALPFFGSIEFVTQ